MHAEDDTHAGRPLDARDRLRHDLKSPLTTIRGRAYLLARAVRRAPSLTDEERSRMLAGVAAMVVVIDGIDDDLPPRKSDSATDRS